jgi:hypothetical protein
VVGVAVAVLLEGGAMGVEFPAVELDDQSRLGPEHVDLVTVDEHVGLRRRQAMGDDERRKPILERRRGVFDVACLGEEKRLDVGTGYATTTAFVNGGNLGHAQHA